MFSVFIYVLQCEYLYLSVQICVSFYFATWMVIIVTQCNLHEPRFSIVRVSASFIYHGLSALCCLSCTKWLHGMKGIQIMVLA
jgi:hypothetical protein